MNLAESETKIFRLPYAHYNLLMPGVVGVFCIGMYMVLGITQGMAFIPLLAIGGILTLMWSAAILYSRWMFANNFLAISRQGIYYRAPGVHINARWDDLDYIGEYYIKSISPKFNRKLTVIYLKENASVSVIPARFFSMLEGPTPSIIPVGDFGPHEKWRKSEIGQLLRHYAPHLMRRI